MSAELAWTLPSYRRQDLLLEFASLKHVRMQGIYATLTPGSPDLWRCALFVRKGPYAGAVLRFRMSFPEGYPFTLPNVIFDPSVFHPLVVPEARLADDDVFVDAPKSLDARGARLVGSLNLKVGFPGMGTLSKDKHNAEQGRVNAIEVLLFVRSCFDNSEVLSNLNVNDVVNEIAWKAWLEHDRALDTEDEESTWESEINLLLERSIVNEELFDHVVIGVKTSES